MKSLKIFSIAALLVTSSFIASAQDSKTETIAVNGNCGMCKNNIEKAAKAAGVQDASWDQDKKILTVTYIETATSNKKIQEAVAAAGYDTKEVRATDDSYKKLHACCQYDREAKDSKGEKGTKGQKADKGTKGDKGLKAAAQDTHAAAAGKESCCSDEAVAGAETKKSCCSKEESATATTGKEKSCCAKN